MIVNEIMVDHTCAGLSPSISPHVDSECRSTFISSIVKIHDEGNIARPANGSSRLNCLLSEGQSIESRSDGGMCNGA